ncbi:MAG TPA: hypothetical protein VFD64_00595 [Gemmatimonadaceae bacterium]|nr:hypothetical protein [Gemmatimonadaceae bacterium]
MAVLSTWSPPTLVALIIGYAVIAMALVVAPMVLPMLRESWRARREHREPVYDLFRTYPAYLLRYRRVIRLLIVPPILFIVAWIAAKLST